MCRYCKDERVKGVLTERELSVVHLMESGKNAKEIAIIKNVTSSAIYNMSYKGYAKLSDLDFHIVKQKNKIDRKRDMYKKVVCTEAYRSKIRLELIEKMMREGSYNDYKGEYARLKGEVIT